MKRCSYAGVSLDKMPVIIGEATWNGIILHGTKFFWISLYSLLGYDVPQVPYLTFDEITLFSFKFEPRLRQMLKHSPQTLKMLFKRSAEYNNVI